MYKIKVTHTAPTYKQFSEWGVQQAYSNFFINISFIDDNDEKILWCQVKVSGFYYCSGSVNFDTNDIVLENYNFNEDKIDKKTFCLLLESEELVSAVEYSISGSLIPNDPIRIIETINQIIYDLDDN